MFFVLKYFPIPCKKQLAPIIKSVTWFIDLWSRMVGIILSTISFFLLQFGIYLGFSTFVPILLKKRGFWTTNFYIIIAIFLYINVWFNYFSTMWHGPGHPPKSMSDEQKALLINDPENQP